MYRSFSPYRICPLGAHVDHQKGLVTGFAIDKGITFDYEILDNDLIDLVSNNYEGRVLFYLSDNLEKQDDWANQLRGVTINLRKKYSLKKGIKALINGELPTGGLSSSSAIGIAFMKAIAHANDFSLTSDEIINIIYWSETEFVGLKIGLLDPSCEVLCEENKLLFLDTLTNKYENIEQGKSNIDFELLIVFCGVERQLVNTSYNVRVDECKSASYALKSYENMPYDKYKNSYLRDVPKEVFVKHKDKLPVNFMKRATHFYDENQRVLDGIKAWSDGNITEFGRLINESGQSSIELYESGSKPLIELINVLRKTDGVLGTRFMGGGFNGACLAIIRSDIKNTILANIKEQYLKIFPQYQNDFSMHLCKITNGVKQI